MKKDVKRNRRPGFTLVELLIVIIIIGILAGGMMMVAGAGTDKANATKIVSDLRNMKSAALMYYADKTSWPTDINQLKAYIDRDVDVAFDLGGTSKDLIGYKGGILTKGIMEKLADTAVASGLLDKGGKSFDKGTVIPPSDGVWMRIY